MATNLCSSQAVHCCVVTLKILTLAALRHLDGDCKGTVTGSYRSNLGWV